MLSGVRQPVFGPNPTQARLARSCEIGQILEYIVNEGCVLKGSP